jgi:peptide deformylase
VPDKRLSAKPLPADRYELTAEDQKRFAEEHAGGMVSPQDPLLSRPVQAVDPKLIGSSRIRSVVNRLLEVAGSQQSSNQADKRRRTLVGLAAPQIGEGLRIIVVDTKIDPERKKPGILECFINPEIVWRSRETDEWREGCFSAGPVWGLVRRSIAVKVRAFTPEGKKISKVFEGFTARIFQHEIDHLDGIRFPDRIKNDKKRHWVHAEEIPIYPENIHHWPRLCPLKRWEKFKIGS